MSTNSHLHALIPIFNWSWWQIFVFTLIIDWGVVHLLKMLDPPHKKSAHWRAAIYGDIFLPVGIASSAVVAKNFSHLGSWYVSTWWNWFLLALGAAAIFAMEFIITYKIRKIKNRNQLLTLGNFWHTVVFIPMFYFSALTLIPLFATRSPVWAFLLALFGYSAWLFALVRDIRHPPKMYQAT